MVIKGDLHAQQEIPVVIPNTVQSDVDTELFHDLMH